MAKSIRSKRKRAMRAIKRVRYAVKEKTKLVEMLKAAKNKESEGDDAMMTDIMEQCSKVDSADVIEKKKAMFASQDVMESDVPKRQGFPIWMNKKKIKRKQETKKIKKKTKKR